MEAIKFLAEKTGIPVPEDSQNDRIIRLKKEILEINKETARFYHSILRSNEGTDALNYLLDRGLSGKTIGKFGLGYAPDSWDRLYNYLSKKGFSDYALSSAFVVKPGGNKKYYDVFRNRIIFPIIDLRGNVIAFGGRILKGDGPKYLNSGDTPVFKKSNNLFALNLAKSSKQPLFILSEGYMDVISMHQAGFDNAVATLGTALTSQQARLINSYRNEVALCYDSDEAGQKATAKAIKIFEETDIKVKVISIPGAKDPDEFIKKNGAVRFKLIVDGSAGSTDYALGKIAEKYDLETPHGKLGFVNDFCKYIAEISSPVERDIYITRVSEKLQIDRGAVNEQVINLVKKHENRKKYIEKQDIKMYTDNIPSKNRDPNRAKYIKYALAEDMLMSMLIRNQDFWKKISDIKPENFITDFNREIYRIMYERLSEGKAIDINYLGTVLNDEQMSHISYILAKNSAVNGDLTLMEENIKTIKEFDPLMNPKAILESSPEELLSKIQKKRK